MKSYKKYLIKDGLVGYQDQGIVLLTKSVLDKGIKTIINKPVIITHEGTDKVGEVIDCYYDYESGNYIVVFNIFDEKAEKLLDGGYSISSTFIDKGKTKATDLYHNIEYDYDLKEIEFENIAIVKEPRYQECNEYVNSSENNNFKKLKSKINYLKLKERL